MAAPPLTQSDAVTSLLSLSIAAASMGASPSPRQPPTLLSSPSHKHHRRLASAGKTRRRLSDAREASSQPLPASNTAALSLASLSLSASPPSTKHSATSTSFSGICKPLAPKPHSHSNSIHVVSESAPNPVHVPLSRDNNFSLLASAATSVPRPGAGNADNNHDKTTSTVPIPISNGKTGTKKRGIDYKCESCSKVYRHPNCLNKHRWEHTRQWREASKFVLSKHQQVQLLEAAAILSFMGKQPASLPEDRSEWPSFLSGGSLPKVESAVTVSVHSASTSASPPPSESSLASDLSSATSNLSHFPTTTTTSSTTPTHPISSSVPNPQSSGPRLHDYALKAPGGKVVVTQVRPGLLLGVNNDPTTASMPAAPHHHAGYSYDYGYTPPVVPAPNGDGGLVGTTTNNNAMWSLPNSSIRSHGRSLSSLSGSVSVLSEDGDIAIGDDEDDDDDDVDIDNDGDGRHGVFMRNGRHGTMMMGGIDDVDGMDHDEIYDEHNDNEDDDEEVEEGEEGTTQTQQQQQQSETYSRRYTSRYRAAPPRMDDMDIEMDMDMD